MSYGLSFCVPSTRSPIGARQFRDYFAGRAHYRVTDQQAWYSNEATGVYFSFDHASGEETEDEVDEEGDPLGSAGLQRANVSFNLNFFRPHVFALEAEPEVAAFVGAFDLQVDDQQGEGGGLGPYSTEAFFRGWNAGNLFACAAVRAQGQHPLLLPAASLQRHWRWNHAREAFQKRIGDETFVPGVYFFRERDLVVTVVVWGDAMPIALPDVDRILVVRKQLAPGGRGPGAPEQDRILVPLVSLAPVLSLGKRMDSPAPCTVLQYASVPREIEAFVRALREEAKPDIEQVATDRVLDRENFPGP